MGANFTAMAVHGIAMHEHPDLFLPPNAEIP